jgi:hypothetical protein
MWVVDDLVDVLDAVGKRTLTGRVAAKFTATLTYPDGSGNRFEQELVAVELMHGFYDEHRETFVSVLNVHPDNLRIAPQNREARDAIDELP